MRPHQADAARPQLVFAAKKLRMDQVDRADVQRRRHAHLSAKPNELFDEIEADLAMIEATVDMRRLGIDEVLRTYRLGEANEQPHGKARRAVRGIAQQLAVVFGDSDRH